MLFTLLSFTFVKHSVIDDHFDMQNLKGTYSSINEQAIMISKQFHSGVVSEYEKNCTNGNIELIWDFDVEHIHVDTHNS